MANVKELVRTIIRETCTHWICADEQELERVETELEQKLNELVATERAQAGSSDEAPAALKNFTKRFFSWGDILIGFIAGVFGTVIALAYIF